MSKYLERLRMPPEETPQLLKDLPDIPGVLLDLDDIPSDARKAREQKLRDYFKTSWPEVRAFIALHNGGVIDRSTGNPENDRYDTFTRIEIAPKDLKKQSSREVTFITANRRVFAFPAYKCREDTTHFTFTSDKQGNLVSVGIAGSWTDERNEESKSNPGHYRFHASMEDDIFIRRLGSRDSLKAALEAQPQY